jgi:metal-sulfur cluster biosynthetic enzyme
MKILKNKEDIISNIQKNIYDPDLSINIVDLGLIYSVSIKNFVKNKNQIFKVFINMTFTNPFCTMKEKIKNNIKNSLHSTFKNISSIKIKFVWEPLWNKNMISKEGKLQLGIY